ncbi:MAG: threonine synthase [Christensenellaceae bacterium]|jgi:threonine synthase|nr:threonine synthase [Christensenellaceae bacterium]
MEYISTRGEKILSSGAAILKGLASDGGLYVPVSFPQIDALEIEKMCELDYAERASLILSKFLTDFDIFDLKEMCAKAYAKFENADAAPIVKVDDDAFLMELWHGPTSAFKDVALTLLPYLLTYARQSEGTNKKTLILVATSGDTGKAALEGFADVPDTEIIVFYPSDGVSEMQKLQMQTTVGKNVNVIGINGNFDDAQTAVKQIFKDPATVEQIESLGYSLSSANSINWGRLAPQIAYYFSAYVDLVSSNEIKNGTPINFVVPVGNFGNVLAAYYAKKMGLPVNKLLIASNSNNILTDFFKTGIYDTNRKFFKTISPSMDILISSNLERLLFEISNRDPSNITKLMSEFDMYGLYEVPVNIIDEEAGEFIAYWSDEDETSEALYNFYDMFEYLLDPHTAVAVAAYFNYIAEEDDPTKTVIVSTANPYKFPQDVLNILTRRYEKDAFKAIRKLELATGIPAPDTIAELSDLSVIHTDVINKSEVKNKVLSILHNINNAKESN